MSYRVANIEIDQGASFTADVSLVDPASNVAINITDYELFGQIRKYYTSSNSVTMNVFATNASAGQLTLALDANTSGMLVSGEYVYDVIMIDTSNTVIRLLEGQVTINPQTTLNPWQSSTLG